MSDDPTQPSAPPPPPHPTVPLPGEPAGQPPPDGDGRSFWVIVAMHLVLLAWMAWLWWNLPGGTPAPTEATEPTMVIEPAAK